VRQDVALGDHADDPVAFDDRKVAPVAPTHDLNGQGEIVTGADHGEPRRRHHISNLHGVTSFSARA
jgi:hypothetical protein